MCELTLWSDPMIAYLWCARINSLLAIVAIVAMLARNRRWAFIIWALAAAGWLAQAGFFLKGFGLTSLSGIAPNFTLAAVILSLWQIFALKSDCEKNRRRPMLSALFLLLMALCSMVPEELRHDTFMMTYIYAKLFFLSRPVTLGLTLFAMAGFFDALLRQKQAQEAYIADSRQSAILAAVFFLGGEIAGCYWGFMGWGTTWRWSGNFYYSAMIFVLFMVALHVPRSIFSTARSYVWGMFAPLYIIALAMILSKVVQS